MEYAVPSQYGKQIPVPTKLRDQMPNLDVVWAKKYEYENVSPENAKEQEAQFYKGAPPQWLNFYWAEKNGCPLVKRDMYDKLRKETDACTHKSWSITRVHLRHQPGSGGSTLAMQLLWDLRKRLRCAKVLASTADSTAIAVSIAGQVVQLFNAGGPTNQNTVLLLLDNVSDDPIFEKVLEDNITNEIKKNKITATVPVVIIFSCIRQLTKSPALGTRLSETEKTKLKAKKAEIVQSHGDGHTKFHAFNIMLGNYSPSDVAEICTILHPIKTRKRPREAQLLAYIALVNTYAPGSYLTLDLCKQFFENNNNAVDDFSLEKQMQPFTEILAIFSTQEGLNRSEHVRMAHPMIAKECLQLLTSAGVTRSDITRNLLNDLCKHQVPLYMLKTVKKILTKRETKQDIDSFEREDKGKSIPNDKVGPQRPDKDEPERQAKFSRLIQDIKETENKQMCVSVLKMASKKLDQDPFLPQALARFYYIEMSDYVSAENWAKTAIKRDKENSFIRDTLGQVHKNHLKKLVNKEDRTSRKILMVGKKATEAFKDEAEAAEKEQAPEMNGHGVMKTSNIFNNRGLYGFMEAANTIFYHLTKDDKDWTKVLTKETSPQAFFRMYPGIKCGKHKSLLESLSDEVEERFKFFEQYLTYSKPSTDKDEPSYFRPNVEDCYNNYVTQSGQDKTDLQTLKENKVSTFAGLLYVLHSGRDCDLELITNQLMKCHLGSQEDADAAQNFILANIILSQSDPTSKMIKPLKNLRALLKKFWAEQKDKRSPEFYLLVLLLFWPSEELVGDNSPDIQECIRFMRQSFERTLENYLRSRYLMPLFFLGGGNGLQRLVHASKLDEASTELIKKGEDSAEIPGLQRVQGKVKSYKVFFVNKLNETEIEVSPQNPSFVRHQGNVSFHLGFNIKGPVAYNIRYEQ